MHPAPPKCIRTFDWPAIHGTITRFSAFTRILSIGFENGSNNNNLAGITPDWPFLDAGLYPKMQKEVIGGESKRTTSFHWEMGNDSQPAKLFPTGLSHGLIPQGCSAGLFRKAISWIYRTTPSPGLHHIRTLNPPTESVAVRNRSTRADDENRTRLYSLGSCRSTDELHPRYTQCVRKDSLAQRLGLCTLPSHRAAVPPTDDLMAMPISGQRPRDSVATGSNTSDTTARPL